MGNLLHENCAENTHVRDSSDFKRILDKKQSVLEDIINIIQMNIWSYFYYLNEDLNKTKKIYRKERKTK